MRGAEVVGVREEHAEAEPAVDEPAGIEPELHVDAEGRVYRRRHDDRAHAQLEVDGRHGEVRLAVLGGQRQDRYGQRD